MRQHISVSRIIVVLGIVLLVAPALFPVQSMLFHNTRAGTTANGTELQEHGVTVIAYENLSERGKELYVETLRNNGEYVVPVGEGAPDFDYSNDDQERDRRRPRPDGFAIKRPVDADLPPPHEPIEAAEYELERAEREREARERSASQAESDRSSAETGNTTAENETTPTMEERREQIEKHRQEIARYDLMQTRTGTPPLTAMPNLVRLLSAVGGVLALGIGGYLSSRP